MAEAKEGTVIEYGRFYFVPQAGTSFAKCLLVGEKVSVFMIFTDGGHQFALRTCSNSEVLGEVRPDDLPARLSPRKLKKCWWCRGKQEAGAGG